MVVVLATVGCRPTEPPPAFQPLPGEPILRVRLTSDAKLIRLTRTQPIQIRGADGTPQIIQAPLAISRNATGWNTDPATELTLPPGPLVLKALDGRPILYRSNYYPGTIRLVPRKSTDTAGFDVVNHVHIENYLPGVIAHELYDDWHLATHHAQAIVARSYALFERARADADAHYDLQATVASQVYRGLTDHPPSLQAVRDTVGLVLTWDNRIIHAFYSSTCGGAGLSPLDAFDTPAAPPLTPKRRQPWCAFSPSFEWNTIERDRQTLSRRLAGYGRHFRLPLRRMALVSRIEWGELNDTGRPARFVIQDVRGSRFTLAAETFRNACNFSSRARGIARLPRRSRLPSSFCRIEIDGSTVRFVEGRGFGHGVGLCQFGAEGMARQGYDASEILSEFYPGADIDRAY
jgi:stage II sporulation protein D